MRFFQHQTKFTVVAVTPLKSFNSLPLKFLSTAILGFMIFIVISPLALAQSREARRRGNVESSPPAEQRHTTAVEQAPSFQRFHYDLGLSTGTSRGTSFYEINLGLEIFIMQWLSIRNAPFLRFQSGQDKNYGLDSSGRLNYTIGADQLNVDLHGGMGYRFQNLRSNVPFGEGGLGLQIGGLHIGGNVKVLVYSWVNSGASNEIVYTLSASGSGGF